MGSRLSLPIPLILEETLADQSRFSLNSSALSSLPSGSKFLHIISFAGSKNTGKSTLANHAFSLNFPTMTPDNYGQATRGIDLQFNNLYVFLDMEGSENAERDTYDYLYIARMIGAFSLVVSNLLIYNINIRDIRSTMEVDYIANMMTHYLRICKEKRKILFCIRDVVEGFHDIKDIRDKISQTFKDAWNEALASLRNESNNQTPTDLQQYDLESVFEIDMITCSVYGEAEGTFENEEEVMRKFRDKVKEKLRDLNQFDVESLDRLWSEMWSRIDRNKITKFGKILVKKAWEVLRQKLIAKCYSLVSEMYLSGDYVNQLNEYDTQIFNEFRVNYAHDEYTKYTLLTLWKQELMRQAVYLEVEHFKISIRNYFNSESEHTHTLYKDLIFIYQQIDKDDSDILRIMKPAYMKFLHESATEKNLYKDTIHQTLNSIYSISHHRINQYLAQLNSADIIKINLQGDLSDIVCRFGDFLNTAPRAYMITGGLFLRMGATIADAAEKWKRETVWRDMTTEARRSIRDHDSFQITYQKLIDMIKISDRSTN